MTPLFQNTIESSTGERMYSLISDLYPICRSITGDGVRETLRRLAELIPLQTVEVPTGTPVFDWTVPREWNIRGAHIKDSSGRIVVDFRDSNLHVLNYSAPVSRRMQLDELKEHIFTIPEHPDWIPYRTSYYREDWGFCMTERQKMALRDDRYDVLIDSSLRDGSLTIGECYLPGEIEDEILISTHVCHPSLCNDNLSGIAVACALAAEIAALPRRRHSFRFLFVPGTIGSIAWLALNEKLVSRVQHGLVLSCLGDSGHSTYKKSRRGNAEVDRAMMHVLKHSGQGYHVLDFSPYGYDERQYCSPGFNLPVGCLMRTPFEQYPEYHTSADNLDLVSADSLADSFNKCLAALSILDQNRRYLNRFPKCEPQLGRRGLYRMSGGRVATRARELAILWVLNFSDGENSLLDIADRSGMSFPEIREAADALLEKDLLQPVA